MPSKLITTAIVAVALSFASSRASSARVVRDPVDACALLTQAQVSAVLGASVGPGQPMMPGNHSTCSWSEPGASKGNGKRVALDVFGPIGGLSPADRFNNAKKPVQSITKTPVTGVGDDAYFITTPGLGTGLNVRKGSSVFQLRVNGFPPDQIQTIEKVLAKDVLAKL